jgi:flagellar biosynthesis/type III secretory pathway chaperone
MFRRIVKWMSAIVNQRICSVDQFRAVLQKMEAEAQYDADGFITVSESIKLLVKCFKHVRDW